MERCNRSVFEILRKLKVAEGTDKWWCLMPQVERVMNGQYHQGLEMKPFEAFYGSMRIHHQLRMRRNKQMEKQNEQRRMVVEPLEMSADESFSVRA